MQNLGIHRNNSDNIRFSHVTILHHRKTKLCKGYSFSRAVKIVLFISDIQSYIPIKLCKAAGSIHLFQIKGTLKQKI